MTIGMINPCNSEPFFFLLLSEPEKFPLMR
jgi:hypothetical protein